MSKIVYKIKSIIKKLTPKFIFKFYHLGLALLANVVYGFPSKKMIVIGITGTNGKTTTSTMIAKVLEDSGLNVGMMTTIAFKIGSEEWVNTSKQGMQGRFKLQKYLKRMLDNGCTHVIVESTSQGIEQFRSFGISYDICVFTNITPEHIESHGGFENYKKAKLKLFKQLESRKEKVIKGKKIDKVIVANFDDNHVLEFVNFNVDKVIGFKICGEHDNCLDVQNFIKDPKYSFLKASHVDLAIGKASFDVELKSQDADMFDVYAFDLQLTGLFNVYNSLAATSVAYALGLDINSIKESLSKINEVKGRMNIVRGHNDIFGVVDYAHDPNSVAGVYSNLLKLKKSDQRLIAVLGSCGGGRDSVTRFDKGNAAGAICDYVVVTNEDPYDDDPQVIIDDVFAGVINEVEDKNSDRVVNKNIRNSSNKKTEGVNAFKILDRREAIAKAVSLAKPGDIIVCTGKGAEKAIAVANGERIDWDEMAVLTEEINKK